MDTTDPQIEFDADGNCNHCIGFFINSKKLPYRGEMNNAIINELVQKIKKSGKGKKYDCILGLSGGVDSSYAACLAKKFDLRVLAVHMDNGWDSDTAVKNIKNVIEKTGFDYESYVLNWEEFKDLQLAFLKASVPEIETPTDHAIPAALHKIAAKHKIKYIISAGNQATEGILPPGWHYNAKDLTYINKIHRQFGTGKLSGFPLFGYKQEIQYKYFYGIKLIYLLDYIPYSKNTAMTFLKETMDWEYYGGKHYESVYTKFIQSYVLIQKFNIDYRKATYSSQICSGELTREKAIEQLKHLPYDSVAIEKEKNYICKKLGISIQDFAQIMNTPVKSYTDYPNDKKKLEFIYDIYKKLNSPK